AEPRGPRRETVPVRRAEGDMVDAAGPLHRRPEAGLDEDVNFSGRTALAHGEDMQRGAAIDGVNALGPHAEHLGEDELRRGEIGHRERDRPEAADLVVRRHGAVLPRMGLARAAVVDEVEALPLRILEGERRAPRPLADLADRAAG